MSRQVVAGTAASLLEHAPLALKLTRCSLCRRCCSCSGLPPWPASLLPLFLVCFRSTWVTINAESRRLAKIPEAVKQRFLQLAPSPPRCAIPTSDTRRKLPEFVWPPQVRLASFVTCDFVTCE